MLILFYLNHNLDFIPRSNSDEVTTLFNLVFNKVEKPAHIAVKYTAIKVIGELAKWIDTNPGILGM